VPLADFAARRRFAALLIVIGRRRGSPNLGFAAAAIFLFFGDPSATQRLGGVYVRGQCEPFVGVAVAGALAILASSKRQAWHLVSVGVLLAAAFWLKYNAAAYGLPVLAAIWAWAPESVRDTKGHVRALAWIAAGFAAVGVAVLAYFVAAGALHDLRLATIDYNLRYSDETYNGWRSVLTYPFTMFTDRGSVDFLWYLGGLGAALLVVTRARADRSTAVWLSWLAATVLSIAINGHRDLPNYFVQAYPPLAMAAGRRPGGTPVQPPHSASGRRRGDCSGRLEGRRRQFYPRSALGRGSLHRQQPSIRSGLLARADRSRDVFASLQGAQIRRAGHRQPGSPRPRDDDAV
jgi:hypothetical protein